MEFDSFIAKADVLLEALPYIQQFRNSIVLIKFGGSVMESPKLIHSILQDAAFMAASGMKPIIVHGGGKAISTALKKENIEPKFINGLRYTNKNAIDVVDHVLHQEINAKLVHYLREKCSAPAVAVSGKNILRCEKITTPDTETGAPLDLGFVGKVINVDTAQLDWYLNRNQIPIVTPLSCDMDGQIFNVNADMAACVIAAQMQVRKLVFLSDVAGVLKNIEDPTSLISTIHCSQIEQMQKDGIISGGMLPKLASAREAILAGVGKVHMVNGRIRHAALLEIFTDKGVGTQIVP
ncbi:MAG: acetylglutamate kinase [Lentisphaeria bacterium]